MYFFYICVLCPSMIFFYMVAKFLIYQFLYPQFHFSCLFSLLFCSSVLNTLLMWSNWVEQGLSQTFVSCFALPGHFLTLIPALNQYGNKHCTQIFKEACVTNLAVAHFADTQTSKRCPHSIVCQKPNAIGEKKENASWGAAEITDISGSGNERT